MGMTEALETPPDDPVAAFIEWSELDRNRSQHTLKRYRSVLDQIPDPIHADHHDIEAWWKTRYTASPATRSNELFILRAFYKWAVKFDYVLRDPSRRLDPPKVPNNVPRPIAKSDLERVLGTLTADNLDIRRAVALGAYGGLRVSEAAALDWSMIDMDSRRIYVRGKGAKERVNALSVTLQDVIMPNTGGNVVRGGGAAYSGAVLQRKVNRFMARHDIDSTFHDLRKRGATMALAKTKNPLAVAQFFGWSSLQTARSYAVVGDDVLDEIAEAMV